ncbi:hypothetical protein Tco_1417978 [Tanacetum coccineum]
MLRAFYVPNWSRESLAKKQTIWFNYNLGRSKEKVSKQTLSTCSNCEEMEEINNFQQEIDETLYQAWERFKELLMKCPQHYLQRCRSTETSDGLAAIQAQLNNLVREIEKVNEKVYAAQVGCEQCKGPHYTKDFPLKEEGKTLEEAYYTQFVDLSKEGDIEQQLWDSTRGTMQTLCIKNEDNLWKKP